MKDFIVWVIHTPTGTIALIATLVALFSKKGTVLHRKAGTYFTISMLIMLISGCAAAILKESLDDVFLGKSLFTPYLLHG